MEAISLPDECLKVAKVATILSEESSDFAKEVTLLSDNIRKPANVAADYSDKSLNAAEVWRWSAENVFSISFR